MANIKLSRIRYSELQDQIKSRLKDLYNKSDIIFNSATGFGQITDVISGTGDLIFQYIENVVTDLIDLNRTSNPVSILRWAYIAGHNQTRVVSARGIIRFRLRAGLDTSLINCNRIILPEKIRLIATINSLYYTVLLDKDRIVELSSGLTIDAPVVQGQFFTETVNGNGRRHQSISITSNRGSIENFTYFVSVNGVKWKERESFKDMTCEGMEFITRTGSEGGLDIIFGNGDFGKIPERGSIITIEYLISNGSLGILQVDDGNRFDIAQAIYDADGQEVSINDIFVIEMVNTIIFASNGESIEFTRNYLPKASKNFVLTNEEQYEDLLRSLNIFSQVTVYREDFSNVMYLYLVPDISVLGLSYFEIEECEFILTEDEKDRVYDFIFKKGVQVIGTEFKIEDIRISRYVMNIYIDIIEGTDENTLKDEIYEKVSDYFLNLNRRYIIPRSDIVEILKTIEEISYVEVEFISQKNETYHIDGFESPNYNPANLRGLDTRNNIIVDRNELPLLRGGWEDRDGTLYAERPVHDKFSAINVKIERYV